MRDYLIKSIVGLTYDNEKIYLISSCIYAILEYDCKSKETKILSDFPKKVQFVDAFEKILKHGNKIYLFPCMAEDIYCYDLEQGKYYKSNILSGIKDDMLERKFLEVLEFNGNIYCVYRCPNVVICIDPETDDFQIYNFPLETLNESTPMSAYPFSVCMNGNKLVYPYANNSIVEFSTDVNSFKIIYLDGKSKETIGDINDIIWGICVDGNKNYWMYNYRGEVFQLINHKKILINVHRELTQSYYDGYSEQPGIDRMFFVSDDLCFTLRSECKILKYNTITGNIILDENNLAEWNDKVRKIAFCNYAQIDEKAFMEFNQNDGAIYKWDYTRGFIEKIEIKLSFDAIVESQFDKVFWQCNCEDDIRGYIQYIKRDLVRREIKEYENCGEKIYRELI